MKFVLCAECQRHVRAGPACAFCGASKTLPLPTLRGPRRSRAAILFATAAMACGGVIAPDDGGGAGDANSGSDGLADASGADGFTFPDASQADVVLVDAHHFDVGPPPPPYGGVPPPDDEQ